MVEEVVQAKVGDGQLDEAPLTLAELRRVKEQLTRTLVSIFHRRIPYPGQGEGEERAQEHDHHQAVEHRAEGTGHLARASSHAGGDY
jgi:hypothetical protein